MSGQSHKYPKKWPKKEHLYKFQMPLVVLVFVVLGVVALLITRAATGHNLSLEPEDNASCPVSSQSSAQASSGAYAKFGSPSTDCSGVTVVAAGDIACGDCKSSQTANVIKTISPSPSGIILLGDNAYNSGTLAEYNNYFGSTWGTLKTKIYPGIGNHEYFTGGHYDKNNHADGFFNYFKDFPHFSADLASKHQAWYSFDIGAWHFISLDSDCQGHGLGGCGSGDPMGRWLASDLAAHRNACVAAFWHIPMYAGYSASVGSQVAHSAAAAQTEDEFSSQEIGPLASPDSLASSGVPGYTSSKGSFMKPIWQMLYDANADVVFNGHTHDYQRFKPMKPDLTIDPSRGLTQFIIGTGGAGLQPMRQDSVQKIPQLATFTDKVQGVLKMVLKPTSMEYSYAPIPGGTYHDSGTVNCH